MPYRFSSMPQPYRYGWNHQNKPINTYFHWHSVLYLTVDMYTVLCVGRVYLNVYFSFTIIKVFLFIQMIFLNLITSFFNDSRLPGITLNLHFFLFAIPNPCPCLKILRKQRLGKTSNFPLSIWFVLRAFCQKSKCGQLNGIFPNPRSSINSHVQCPLDHPCQQSNHVIVWQRKREHYLTTVHRCSYQLSGVTAQMRQRIYKLYQVHTKAVIYSRLDY